MANRKATASAAIERQQAAQQAALAREGLAKLNAGETLTRGERNAVRQWEKSNLERWGVQYVATCPKKAYQDQVGVSQKVALEQSRRFGLPYHTSGPTIDLFAQLAAWHRWASENKHAINRVLRSSAVAESLGDDDGLEFWQRELVKERAIRERDARQERQGSLLPRDIFHSLLQEFYVEPTRRRIEALERRTDPVCAEVADGLRDDIEHFEEGLRLIFGYDEQNLSDPDQTDSAIGTADEAGSLSRIELGGQNGAQAKDQDKG